MTSNASTSGKPEVLAARWVMAPVAALGAAALFAVGEHVASVSDLRNAFKEVKTSGKHATLMRMKIGGALSFVALPLGTA